MRTHVLCFLLLLGLAFAPAPLSAKDPPKQVMIKACQKSKPPVTMSHEEHTKKAKIECKTCHHKGEGKTCSEAKCHQGKAEGKRPGCAEMSLTKNPFHISCIGCHKKENKGPKTCAKCHKK
jgi:hypothetical protein